MKRIITLVLLALLLMLSGCGGSGITQSDLDDAYEKGYYAGLDDANDSRSDHYAHDVWLEGYTAGVKDGYYGATHGYERDDIYGQWLGDVPED